MCEKREELYDCDLSGCVKKFDVCMCDLGEVEEGDCTLAKIRPCVILQSDDMNNRKTGTYIVAGIKTERKTDDITEEVAEEIVRDKRKVGRIYVPIKMSDGGTRFIEISQLRMISSNKVQRFVGRINNTDLKDRINRAMMELLFSKQELNICENANTEKDVTPAEVPELQIVEESKPERKGNKSGRKPSFPMGMSKYFELYMKGEITTTEIARRLNVKQPTAYYYIK